MYKVVSDFRDIADNNHEYRHGDTYPRDGFMVTEERLAVLSSDENNRGEAVIKAVSSGNEKNIEEKASKPKKARKKAEE